MKLVKVVRNVFLRVIDGNGVLELNMCLLLTNIRGIHGGTEEN
jgi:hypothetical protein